MNQMMQEILIAATSGREEAAVPMPSAERGTAGAILARVRSHAHLQAAWMERLWAEGETSPDQGLAITPSEVERLLSQSGLRAERFERFVMEPDAQGLLDAALDADRALAEDTFWMQITDLFDLDALEGALLCLVIAVELDPALGRVFAYLADDTRTTAPTLQLARTLFYRGNAPPEGPALPNIRRWRLARALGDDPAWRLTTAWQADEALVRSVCEECWLDPALDRWCKLIDPSEGIPSLVLYPDLFEQMRDQIESDQRPFELALAGPDGSGRQTLASQVAASLGRSLLAVDTPALLVAHRSSGVSVADDLARAARLGRAHQALLYWRSPEAIAAPDWAEVRELAGGSVGGGRSIPPTASWGAMLAPLTAASRMELWHTLRESPVPSRVRSQRLNPAQIRLIAEAADGASMHKALVRSAPKTSDLLNILPCPYTWDDLVVAPQLRSVLRDFESQIRLRWEVYEEWGFSRLTHLGQGISACFGGPSGCGKTMAAQVLARSCELTLYRVDLAGVVNKYIGETEKRLRDVFAACEQSGGVLFFDEADALFGSRMQPKDAHDRFANIEIDYLLQRIEQFDGIAILATNRKNDLDAAFLRRLRFVCDFNPPEKHERLTLWQKALPEFSPSGEKIRGDIDFQGLANFVELNGAQIKSIALAAAFLARSEDTSIEMRHLELATAREFAKQGLRLRPPFAKPAVL